MRTIHPTAQKPQRCGRFSSPLRKLRGGDIPPFNVPLRNQERAGDFHRPYETQNILPPKNFRFPPGERYRVGQGTHRMGTSPKRN